MRLSPIYAAILATGLSNTAFAHAHLTAATPPVGSTVKAAPAELAITYSESLEPKFSAIEVQDASGTRVDTGDVHTESGNGKRLVVGLKPLQPGTYKVVWHATSTDTHKSEGSYNFTVSP
jgi:methionine-rich copper-binding protein CopC